MKRCSSLALGLLVAFSATAFAGPGQQVKTKVVEASELPSFVGYVDDEIVVQFDASIVDQLKQAKSLASGISGIPALDALGKKFSVNRIKKQFRFNGKTRDLSGFYKIRLKAHPDIIAVVQEYAKLSGVIRAEPIGIHTTTVVPNDPRYADQYHLPKMQAEQAWDIQTGNSNIIVVSMDTGVRYFHKDLGGANASFNDVNASRGNMWTNTAELNGTPGVDDDGNGFVDDIYGYDWVDNVSSCWSGEDCSTPDNDPRDFNGHGTHVAGILGAMNNNGYAVSSVAGGWENGSNPVNGNGVRIMALRIGWSGVNLFWEAGYVRMDFAAEAFNYATQMGAHIVNCSWGSSNSGGIGPAVDDFIASGGMVFKAAGNSNNEVSDFLNDHPDVISVASTDENDLKSDFSSYGTWVEISAPGSNIWNTYHESDDPANDYVASLSGTSMASPNAASVAALIWSRHPDWTAAQVKQRLYDTADDLDAGNPTYAGKLGAGRVNAYAAVNDGPGCDVSANFTADVTSGDAPLTVNFTDQSTGPVTSWSWDFGDGNTSTAQNPSHVYNTAGTYTVALTVSSATCSNTMTKTNYITVTDPGGVNQPPVPVINEPADGAIFDVGETVNFSGDATDPEDGTVPASNFTWYLSGPGVPPNYIVAQGTKSGSGVPPQEGSYTLTLEVTDSQGLAASTSVNFTVQQGGGGGGNTPPTATITSPANGASYTVGATISYSGTGTDAEDGTLPASAFTWKYSRNGGPEVTFATGVKSGTATATAPGNYQVILIVEDSGGLTDRDEVSITVSGGAKIASSYGDGLVDSRLLGENFIPDGYSLSDAYPNPFNPETTFQFSLPQSENVKLVIYNSLGKVVRTLISNEKMSAGTYTYRWSGRDDSGRTVTSGTYYLRIQAGPMNVTKKLSLLK